MTSSQASSKSYARNIWGIGVDSSAYYRFTTGDDSRGGSSESGAEDFTSNEYGLRFSGAIGEATTFSYSPNWRTYSGERYDDEFGQTLGLNGSVNAGGWQLGLEQTYSDSSYITTETAVQTDEETIGTRVTGNYQVNSSLAAGLGASWSTRDSERFNSSDTTTFDAQISQLLQSNASVALILSAGEEDTNEGFNADFTQTSGSFNYQPSDYLYVSVLLGQQERSFNISVSDLDSTIYSLALNFAPADFTEISVRADSSVSFAIFYSDPRERNLQYQLEPALAGYAQSRQGCEKLQPATFQLSRPMMKPGRTSMSSSTPDLVSTFWSGERYPFFSGIYPTFPMLLSLGMMAASTVWKLT